ncbi:MAG: M24 family metallopeptidase [Arenimonas sp.]
MGHPKQAVGLYFELEAMRFASAQSWKGIERMAASFRPGMRESEATELANKILDDLGMERIWHPVHVRFGPNTMKTFRERSEGDLVLGDDDIYFIDIGPVFRGHEGDVGATFTTGSDPGKNACAQAVKTLFDLVRNAWLTQGLAGPALYDYAAAEAARMGWVLNLDIKGHRVSDFPHAIYKAGSLGAFDGRPDPGIWVLEIQIAHPTRAYGAFYEDVLI